MKTNQKIVVGQISKLREQLEDLNDYLDLLKARARNKGKQTFTMKEVREQLGFKIIGTFILFLFSACAFGQTITGQATFNVIRPTIDFIGSIDGNVALDTNYVGSSGDLYLHFGGSVNNGVTNWGINCTASNPNLQGYDTNSNAGFLVVQIIVSDNLSGITTDGSSHTNTPIVNALDNDYPTKNLGKGNESVFFDAPGIGGFPTNYIQLSKSQSFRTVLMFLPDELQVIPVPIKEIDWNWSATISFTNSQWVLTSSNATITVNNQDTLTFPTWTSAVKNK